MQINWLAVVIAGVVAYGVGMLWYSPWLFGKLWMEMSGLDPKKLKQDKGDMNMGLLLGAGVLAALLIAFTLEMFFKMYAIQTMTVGLIFTFWCWLGFVATVTLYPVLYEKKSFKLFLLGNGHNLISMLVIAVILIVLK
jgi:hypothetical protein